MEKIDYVWRGFHLPLRNAIEPQLTEHERSDLHALSERAHQLRLEAAEVTDRIGSIRLAAGRRAGVL